MDNEQVTYFAETDSRNKRIRFGIKAEDRTRHVYVIGKTGMGKSTLLENMAIQDIQNGNGMAFIDPHGKTADLLLEYVPETRINDVLYFAPFDMEYPISFNVMEDIGPDKRHLVANGLMSAFKKIWVDAWSARMEYILNNILLALLEYPGSTLLGVNRMLADKGYRKKVVENITDPSVKSFWVDEFEKYGERYMQEAGAAIQNKIGQFVSNPLVRNIIGQSKSTFDIRKMMDEGKIIIINLSKGRVGEANANLLGGMIITKLYLGAMSRADVSNTNLKKLPNFYLYVDEFQNFANESFADILSEARKYKLNLTIAHQYIEQMTEEVKAAVFGNVGSMVTFRVGSYDAEVLEKEFAPTFTMEDIVNLDKYQIYLRLMIDGVGSQPFSARTIDNPPVPDINFVSKIIDSSRAQFARTRTVVEEEIKNWHRPIDEVERDNRQNLKKERQDNKGDNFDRPKKVFDDKRKFDNGVKNETPRDFRPTPPAKPNENRSNENKPNVHNPFQKVFGNVNVQRNEKESLNRENELRKAISLDFLKKDEPKVDNNTEKKDKKSLTQESVSELRSALASVLSEVGITAQRPAVVSDKQPAKNTNNSSVQNINLVVQRPNDNKTQIIQNSGNVSTEKKPDRQAEPARASIKEIPEKELRDLLSVEE